MNRARDEARRVLQLLAAGWCLTLLSPPRPFAAEVTPAAFLAIVALGLLASWGLAWFAVEPPRAFSVWGVQSEGFYTLPERIELDGGGYWLKNAIVQLGYNERGRGIIFVGQRQEDAEQNILSFSDRGLLISDDLLSRLEWAPILPLASK